jgi:hypothetical protein
MTLLLLTLEKHKDGIWITRLVERMQILLATTATESQRPIHIGSIDSDDFWLGTSTDDLLSGCKGIVNRVSDAAEAIYVKRTLALLGAARILGIPVFNGDDAYSLCVSKLCHHILFRRAGLLSPSTTIVTRKDHKIADVIQTGRTYLIKPNSGGFGNGIVKITDDNTLPALSDVADDGINLLQEYKAPKNGKFYRVWFLQSKVQCAVERSDNGSFQTGCSSSGCSRNNATTMSSLHSAWPVPQDVANEIERMLSFVPGAHAGSVEFLVDEEGQRLYFDFNLLSTLPIHVHNADPIWGTQYDPWMELAQAVLTILRVL